MDRCRCGDDFCATVYTAPKPEGSFGAGHHNIELDAARGMIVLDLVHDEIRCIEILYRADIRERVLRVLP